MASAKHAFERLEGPSGVVAYKDLGKLARACGLDDSARSVVQIQGLLNELYEYGDLKEDGIPCELWMQFLKLETSSAVHEGNNELLVRRMIGKVKLPTRNLKSNGFVYGHENKVDKEGAGEVVLNWVAGKRSESKEAGVSLMKLNKEALKQGIVTADKLSQFLREHKADTNLQRPKVNGRKKSAGASSRPACAAGDECAAPAAATENKVRGSDMHSIIFPGGGDDEAHYVDTSGQVKKGRLPKPRQTNGSELMRKHTKEVEESKQPQELWKMNKFAKVPHKIEMGPAR